jgi:RNA polymerase sigma-70 factor (ECF subfamily)
VAVVLHYFEDRPVAEIADVLGCAPATARVHLHKARPRLASLLHEEVDDVVG